MYLIVIKNPVNLGLLAFWPRYANGHATRTTFLNLGLLAFWPRYANGHATRTTLLNLHSTFLNLQPST
ncbi:hypothetical protein [Moorena sp. SIO4G3]|uniref:hypothetical protein n=1 Tax=Moorena sp. SIO4G3 TaxID=2607821 RepID=UPI00142B7A54|nr:hypothetical protein [Moorena sp. SIO4G3]NEO75642.1 hypothetical protein [Moorena sp. SIO4G3]